MANLLFTQRKIVEEIIIIIIIIINNNNTNSKNKRIRGSPRNTRRRGLLTDPKRTGYLLLEGALKMSRREDFGRRPVSQEGGWTQEEETKQKQKTTGVIRQY